ncbi:hypothetical protein KSF_032470 [Reticulibacter mediterranei]|uniref:SCP domain-containing protein n=1 Tax=Reticulibacter mediterranei TaxID=2778369 RepID=A0A8J3IKM4_9CHLR|nr:CAP domain-containing protein [Reticulibacter mediterranei]GHO93199.1 hypothetical protein KSF_032470 [Reticulibacter mediterranei]
MKNHIAEHIIRRALLCFLAACLLSVASLTVSSTMSQRVAHAVQGGWCANIPATPNYLKSRRAKDAIAAINHARRFEHLRPLRLPRDFYRLKAAQQQFVLVNLERTDRGLRPLTTSSALMTMARSYSRQLSRQHFFSHTSPTSGTLAQRLNMNRAIAGHYSLAEENLAGNPVGGVGPIYEYMYNDVSEHCGHRANILQPGVTLVGIGVVSDKRYGSISAQEFLALRAGVRALA